MRRLAPALFTVGLVMATSPVAAETRDGEGFQLEIVSPTGVKAGAPATATIAIRPRGKSKLNVDYPVKLELSPRAGARVTKPLLRKQDARTYAATGGAFDVALTVDKAGAGAVDATLRFATCEADACAIHKQTFTITATAR